MQGSDNDSVSWCMTAVRTNQFRVYGSCRRRQTSTIPLFATFRWTPTIANKIV